MRQETISLLSRPPSRTGITPCWAFFRESIRLAGVVPVFKADQGL